MRAVVYSKYGTADVLENEDIAQPVPADDEVLVRIHTASLNPYDWHYMTGLPYVGRLVMGMFKPNVRTLGADLAGVVEEVGDNVSKFQIGDEVFGMVNGAVPGQTELETGTFAEFAVVKEVWLEPKPTEMSLEEAASVPLAAITALQGLRDYGKVQPGQRVLINGASGGVGIFAVQIAKSMGAEVTGVCSTKNVEMVKSLGADSVVDYSQEDFADLGSSYDLLLDNVGNRSLSDCRKVLMKNGMYLASFGQTENLWFGPLRKMFWMMIVNAFSSHKLVGLTQHRKKSDLDAVLKMIQKGQIKTVIDRTYVSLPKSPSSPRNVGS
ncbi:NAD(P)-dependent alcohol dehydrogenase [Planctomycetota bacterium]|nr:NAD(P)-dependent alcohol dehydrogenase [Planctomycetota bacterium]